jgi:prevent-host-death family protein
VLRAARRRPQTVTKHGKPAVVVIDAAEYARLKQLEKLEAPGFAEHLLAMPADGKAFERLDASLRPAKL